MGWLTELLGSADASAQGATLAINARLVAAFRTLLQGQPLIRLYVGTGGGIGNQSATVKLLRRLTEPVGAEGLTYGYTGTVEVYYENGADVLARIERCLPELGGQTSGTLNGATVNLLAYDDAHPPQAPCTFGFTGAVDGGTRNLADGLNAAYVLQLQPYNYNYGEKLWFPGARAAIDLRAVPALNDPSFARRVSYLPRSSYDPPDWSQGDRVKADILRYLTGDDVLGRARLVVSYAIMPSQENIINAGGPAAAAAILSGGLLAWQQNGHYRSAAPVIIVNTNRFGDGDQADPFVAVKSLLDGGMTPFEAIRLARGDTAAARQVRQVFEARRTAMRTLDARTRFTSLFAPASLQDAQTAVQAILGQNNKVLFIQLGPVAPKLFDYALSRTNMVSLFEGPNTLMSAISLGKPFLVLPRIGAGVQPSLYPNVNRGRLSASPPLNQLASAANLLNFDLGSWPTGLMASGPCEDLGAFLRQLTDQVAADDPIPRYFREIRDLYSTSAADKLNVALAYLMNVYDIDHPAQRAHAGPDLRPQADGGNPLNALYETLQAKVTIGESLDLIPGVLAGGNIAAFVIDLLKDLGATLQLTVRTFTHEGEPGTITKITLAGPTNALQKLGVDSDLSVVFEAPASQLQATIEFRSAGAWSIADVPWIRLSRPFLRMVTSDGGLPVTAAAGGTFDALGAELAVLLPTAQGQWLMTAGFAKPYPSIDKAFQIASAVNLVQALPAPLNAVADVGLNRVEVYYDAARKEAAALAFFLEGNSAAPIPLVGSITLDGIVAQVSVIDPKTTRRVDVVAGGTFRIGDAVVAVTVRAPDFVFSGQLASGTLRIADIVASFLPGVELSLASLPAIEEFDFDYTAATGNLSTTMRMVFEPAWTFPILGKDLFTIADVRFAVTRSNGSNTGSSPGTTTLLPTLAQPLVAEVGAFHLGEGRWRFTLAQKPDTTFCPDDILPTYLGWSGLSTVFTFPALRDLALQLDWGGSPATFEFSAATAQVGQPIPRCPS